MRNPFNRKSSHASPNPPAAPGCDREKTERRYNEAVEKLKASIKHPPKKWSHFEIPSDKDFADLNNLIPVLQEDIDKTQEEIHKTLDAWKTSFKDLNLWSKSKYIIERIFTAIKPLAKNVLVVARGGSNVSPVKIYTFDVADSRLKPIRLVVWWITPLDYRIVCVSDAFTDLHRLRIVNLPGETMSKRSWTTFLVSSDYWE
jgi:hypothetical protein